MKSPLTKQEVQVENWPNWVNYYFSFLKFCLRILTVIYKKNSENISPLILTYQTSMDVKIRILLTASSKIHYVNWTYNLK
jgi:hypothetical protein